MDTGQTQPVDSMRTLMVHKRQSNALVGGIFPLLSYGTYFVWAIYVLFCPNEYSGKIDRGNLVHAAVAFFISMILGSVAGYFIVRKYRKIIIYVFVNILTIISGIIFIPGWSIWTAIISRYIGGFALGIALLTVLIHSPEVSSKNLRGAVVAVINAMLATSFLVSSFMLSMSSLIEFQSIIDAIYGGVTILYGVMGLLFIYCFTLESPVFLIQNNQEADALNVVRSALLESEVTYEVRRDFQELKEYVNDEKFEESIRSADGGRCIFTRVLILRLIYTLSTSMLIMLCLFAFSEQLSTEYGFLIITTGRFIFEMLALYWVERFGRKRLLFLSHCACAVISIISAFVALETDILSCTLLVLAILGIFYQIAVGIGMGPVSLVYMTELFSLKKKAVFIMALIIFENILQIAVTIIIAYVTINITALFIVLGVLQACSAAYFFKKLPETKGLTLRECLRAEN